MKNKLKIWVLMMLMGAIHPAHAQDSLSLIPPPSFKRLMFGINVSHDACYRFLQNNNGSSSSNKEIEIRNELERVKMGYTAGVNLYYQLSSLIGLEAGIQYSNKGFQTRKFKTNPAQPEPGLPQHTSTMYHYEYLDLPLKVNFTPGKGRVRFLAGVGIAANILMSESETLYLHFTDHTERINYSSGFTYRRFNLSPLLSLGIDWRINPWMNLRVEPTFRFGVLKIINDPVTGYLYSAGLNVSCLFGK